MHSATGRVKHAVLICAIRIAMYYREIIIAKNVGTVALSVTRRLLAERLGYAAPTQPTSRELIYHCRPNPSFQRKLESSDFEAERHWIPAFAGMTSKSSGEKKR